MLVGVGNQSPGIAAEGTCDLRLVLARFISQAKASGAEVRWIKRFQSQISSDETERNRAVEQRLTSADAILSDLHIDALIAEARRIMADTRASILGHRYDNYEAAFDGPIMQIHATGPTAPELHV